MTFLSPFAALLAAAVAIPALVLLYFLKLRRRNLDISSTLLWRKAIQDMQVNAPFQKLRRNLLLLIQLLLLALLLFAFARPTLDRAVQPGQRMVIVIDHSASMNATDLSPTRLDAAKEQALRLIDDLGAACGAMVISFAHRAQVRQPFTTDRALLRAAVRAIGPTDQLSRIESALQLVAGETQDDTATSLAAYIFTDGRLHDDTTLALPNVALRYVAMGEQPRNVAIVSLTARRDFQKPQIVQMFARLANYHDQPASGSVTIRIDGQVVRSVGVDLPAARPTGSGTQQLQFEVNLPGSALLTVSHDMADDLPADDTAALVIAPPRQLRVLLVTQGNPFLHKAIEAASVKKLVAMTPERYEDQDPQVLRRADDEGFDVIVFDMYAPDQPPPLHSLYFGAVPPIADVRLVPPPAGQTQAQVVLDWNREHPVLRWVALDDVVLVDAGRLALPDTAEVLATGQSGPLMAVTSRDGLSHVMAAFDIYNSDWPKKVSFPVFISNALQWLALGGQLSAGQSFQPGQVARVRAAREGAPLRYTGRARGRAEAGAGGRAFLPVFERVGLYVTSADVAEPWNRIAVNLLDETESDLRPAETLNIGTSVVQATARTGIARREVWRWFIWAALAVLLVEWLVYTRRMHL